QLGVSDRLHFLGHVDEGQLRDAYRDADAFVMPSVHEGFCIPVVEALACGTPVISARATALPETVADAGLTFTPNDPAALARQVRRISSSPLSRKAGRGEKSESASPSLHPGSAKTSSAARKHRCARWPSA